jgi:hypothetical protein
VQSPVARDDEDDTKELPPIAVVCSFSAAPLRLAMACNDNVFPLRRRRRRG